MCIVTEWKRSKNDPQVVTGYKMFEETSYLPVKKIHDRLFVADFESKERKKAKLIGLYYTRGKVRESGYKIGEIYSTNSPGFHVFSGKRHMLLYHDDLRQDTLVHNSFGKILEYVVMCGGIIAEGYGSALNTGWRPAVFRCKYMMLVCLANMPLKVQAGMIDDAKLKMEEFLELKRRKKHGSITV